MLEERDLNIITKLRQNGREQLTRISRSTGIPVSTIFDRINHFEDDELVRHTTLLDFAKLGFSMMSILVVRVRKDEREHFKQYLLTHHNVNNLFKINNGYDFLVECIFKSMYDFEEFQEQMDEKFNIRSKETFYIIENLKREAFLTDEHHIGVLFGMETTAPREYSVAGKKSSLKR